jgi:hypothetical protein
VKVRAGKMVMEMGFIRPPGDPFVDQSNAVAVAAEPDGLRPTPAARPRVGSPHEGEALGESSKAARVSLAGA